MARRSIAAGLLLVVGLTAFVTLRSRRSTLTVDVLARASARLDRRPVDGRLSGGFPYRPRPRAPSRSASEAALRQIAVTAPDVDATDADPRALAITHLMTLSHDKAIELLTKAVRQQPSNAVLLNDLSVAHYARAKARDFAADYTTALDTAERAWRLSRTPETAWNRAVAISAFHLADAATLAWKDLLQIERDVQWRAEAEQRLAELSTSTASNEWNVTERQLEQWNGEDPSLVRAAVGHFPARTLAYFEEKLLPSWGNARINRAEATATQRLRLAHLLAEAIATDGDAFPSAAVRAIDIACAAAKCDAIAAAHVRFAEARALMDKEQYHDAGVALAELRARFESLDSPFALVSRFRAGACMLHENQFDSARTTGAALYADLRGHHYRTLQARSLWLLGLATLHDARPEESIDHYQAARNLFAAAKDAANVASMELLLADAHEFAGNRDVAMAHRIAAFAGMRASGDTRQLFLALFECGTSTTDRWPDAADFFLHEAARQAVSRGRPPVAALACMWRSMLATRRGDLTAAATHAREARGYSARMTDPGQQELVAANIKQLQSSVKDDTSAAEQLTETIAFFERSGNRAWLPQLLRQRALVYERQRDQTAAEADLRRAVDVLEDVLDQAAPAMLREAFRSDARATYEDLIRLLLDRGASRDALAYAERARLLGHGRHAGRDVLSATAAMPALRVAIVLETHSDRLVAWLVTRNSVALVPLPEKTAVLQKLADATSPPSGALLGELYDALLSNWLAGVAAGTEIVFLPPPSLASVPFAALRNRQTNRAVVDDYVVSVAPSLTAASRAQPVTLSATDSVLIVGNPRYGQSLPLPRSRMEVATIATKYRRATTLTAEQAVATRVIAELSAADAFHFGGHAVVNELAPEMSSLVLASEGTGDTHLYVHELLQRQLPLKLVVLSACETARSRSGSAAASVTIARAFLDGGARAVVATLWPVRDDEAAFFSTSLHDALVRGEEVAAAVRAAQLRMKRRPGSDGTWAAFCVLKTTGSHEGGKR